MAYDFGQSKILDIRQKYSFKSTDGALRAHIDGGPRELFNGVPAQNIPLTTKFNNVTLTATPVEVVNAASSTAGGNADLVISAGALPTDAGGDYTTSFTVMFDSTPPP